MDKKKYIAKTKDFDEVKAKDFQIKKAKELIKEALKQQKDK